MIIFLPKYPIKDVLTSKVGFKYLILVREIILQPNCQNLGQNSYILKNSDRLEPKENWIRKVWSLQIFGKIEAFNSERWGYSLTVLSSQRMQKSQMERIKSALDFLGKWKDYYMCDRFSCSYVLVYDRNTLVESFKPPRSSIYEGCLLYTSPSPRD